MFDLVFCLFDKRPDDLACGISRERLCPHNELFHLAVDRLSLVHFIEQGLKIFFRSVCFRFRIDLDRKDVVLLVDNSLRDRRVREQLVLELLR
jgi:hypothetical protein